ncbi:MAG: 2-oxoacid:acceptor oxidoreductase subunit alpha [Alphaproteobacteria bacterium]|nr:2-oxoacid:acceptor oxidoreductase subunit alpha [Alphaproteobacteria bacterium]
MATDGNAARKQEPAERQELDSVVVRFAGDSGDGVQLTGSRFTETVALAGNDLETFPDFPAEIRAPIGTTYGVSAFQINFGSRVIMTSGDAPDVLVAFNPAALKTNVTDLKQGGLVILDIGTFNDKNFEKAGYKANPLDDGSLARYRIFPIDVSKHTLEAVKESGVNKRDGLRTKNFWALGLVDWMYDRDVAPTIKWIESKFAKEPEIAKANIAALKAGHAFGETAEMPDGVRGFTLRRAELAPGLYRTIIGSESLAYGLIVGAKLAGLDMFFSSYPITPASAVLHTLAGLKAFGVTTFQAEDEIAAIGAAIGAAYAGALGITSSSGPGIALKTEALGLAITTELPLIVLDTQRAGPSTGMPTKTEQSDLNLAVYGRNGDAPLIVLSARSPSDAFDVAIEAVRLATQFMTPVIVLSDTYISNAAEPWLVPDVGSYKPFPVRFRTDPEGFHPFVRDAETLARPWVKPGTPGLAHRVGGLEKNYNSGNISYDPINHQRMTDARKAKIDGVANAIPDQIVDLGEAKGDLVVVGWGSTFGPIYRAVSNVRRDGKAVSHIHLRHLWPLPRNLGDLLKGFDHVLVPEMNTGQLVGMLRNQYLVRAEGFNKVMGRPFTISEIEAAIRSKLD